MELICGKRFSQSFQFQLSKRDFVVLLAYVSTVRCSFSNFKISSPLSKAAKTSRGPEEGPGRIGDFSATSELRKLKRKIKSIMENWLEYYQIAFGQCLIQWHKY